MVTLMVGVLLVAVSAVVFGVALFGRRPVPQPAMSAAVGHLGVGTAEAVPSSGLDPLGRDHDEQVAALAPRGGVIDAGWWRRLLQREPTADHQPSSDVTLSPWVRVRSGLFLTLIVTGLAAIIGILASIVVVGLVLLVT